MNRIKKLLVIFLCVVCSCIQTVAAAAATTVKYNVIAFPREFGGAKVGLVLDGGNVIEMTPSFSNSKWSVDANLPTRDFHFIILSSTGQRVKEETLNREWDAKTGITSSQNYIFGKLNNNIPDSSITTIPRAYQRLQNEDEFSRLYQEGEIQVINIIADETVIQNLHASQQMAKVGSDSDTIVEMVFLENNKERLFTNVTMSFSGMGSRGHAKRPYKIKLSDGDGEAKENRVLYGRKNFKLRNLVYDCTYVKQKMMTDIGHAIGVILPQVGFARLYMNGKPYGLYELTDNPKKNWIKKVIHIDALPENMEVGSYYKGVSYSDEVFIPATFRVEPDESKYETLYECENEEPGQANYTELKEFINWLTTINDSTTEEQIRSKFEVDLFLKYMVLEYLSGHWDGYWIGGNNFYLYHNPVTDKYLFITFDFDLTLGIWDPYPPATSYSVWGVSKKSQISPVLVDKFIKHPVFKKLFEDYLKTTVEKVFNVNALGPRLDYFKEYLHDDIAWDRKITPSGVALTDSAQFTLEESLKAYDTRACENDYGIKEWVKLRSEYVAKQFSFTIPTTIDTKLGEVGKKIQKIDKNDGDDNNKGAKAENSISNGGVLDMKSISVKNILFSITMFMGINLLNYLLN